MNLFVYGTLAPGEPNEHELADVQGTWTKGKVRGTLYPSGWGAALGYPGIVLASDGEFVEGDMLSSSNLSEHLERLDEFEGEGYERVVTKVYLENGKTEEAFIYQLTDKLAPI